MREPLELWRDLEGRELIAAASAVSRFEKILGTVGGAREKARWEDTWRCRVRTVETPTSAPLLPAAAGATATGGGGGDEVLLGKRCRDTPRGVVVDVDVAGGSRVWSLKRIAANQLEVFETGEAARALTFTANGKAVASAAEQGVNLEAHVHRAVWLVGL